MNLITPEKIAAVKALLAQGRPHRLIAEMTGVSRTSVGKISQGKPLRKPQALRPPQIQDCDRRQTPVRCRGCGDRVYPFPGGLCVKCQLAEITNENN